MRDDLTVSVALDFYLASLEDSLLHAGLGALTVRVDDESWVLGPGDVVASVAAPGFELFRALGGRRTHEEIAALEWSGDADRFAGFLSRYPMPQRTLGETSLLPSISLGQPASAANEASTAAAKSAIEWNSSA